MIEVIEMVVVIVNIAMSLRMMLIVILNRALCAMTAMRVMLLVPCSDYAACGDFW